MRTVLIPLCLAFDLASNTAFSQTGSEPAQRVQACSTTESAVRSECSGESSRSTSPRVPANDWTITETISPVDYTPVVLAVTAPRQGSDTSSLHLLLACRGGRTEFIVTGPDMGRPEDYSVSYRVNNGDPFTTLVGKPLFGTGTAFKTDVVRLMQYLPDEGYISIHLARRAGPARDERFSLSGLKVVRAKLAAACKWPQAVADPRN